MLICYNICMTNTPETDIFEYLLDDQGWIRVYTQDGGWHSASFIAQDRHYDLVFAYMRGFAEVFTIKDNIRNTLMIGGGMYSFPKYVISHYPEVYMDVVEKDPECFKTACSYFYLDELIDEYHLMNEKRLITLQEEGRHYLEHTSKKYDVIFNDAYYGVHYSIDLASVEAVKLMKEHLNEDGIYVANLPGYLDLDKSELLLNELKTLKEVFRYVLLIETYDMVGENEEINYVAFASDGYKKIEGMIPYNLDGAMVLTDDNSQAYAEYELV